MEAIMAADNLTECTSAAVGMCFEFLGYARSSSSSRPTTAASSSSPPVHVNTKECGVCGVQTLEFSRGARGNLLCRECLRREDEALMEPISEEERRGLDLLAGILDAVPWSYWKPGEQPSALLDWLYLGDLEEAVNFELLQRKGITAVVNLINWWELAGRMPEVADMDEFYSRHSVAFLEADSEDRLFYDIVGKSWPEVEAFLDKCRSNGQRVLVNCKAGHNRSACVCVCWLLVREGMTLLEAVEWVLLRRGTILSNHGFRLQLVRLALSLGRLGERTCAPSPTAREGAGPLAAIVAASGEGDQAPALGTIITKKRLSAKYDHNSKDFSKAGPARVPIQKGGSLISEDVAEELSQRTLKMELLACLYHRGETFRSRYEYTSDPPTVIGSGFSGDVVLCRKRERVAVSQNRETGVRCVKTFFNIQQMGRDRLEKLKNECVIYLSLEHPHIARLFDAFEDDKEVSLVMQYCSGGTLEDALRVRGAYKEPDFKQVAVPMLAAVNYIHRMGIVHRDIKPRNWVYEADGQTVKLIDFGFSAKACLSAEVGPHGLLGCMGTLGYLAPEVVRAGLSADAAYTEKCDIWSLGVVFYELLAGQAAFHREKGECDGYTEEVVLRDIEDVTSEGIEELLQGMSDGPRRFLRLMLTKDPAARPSAQTALELDYLLDVRQQLLKPEECHSVGTVLARFRAHSKASKTSRAWLLAVARSPTHLPWSEFCKLRNTFKMFDARTLSGTVSLDAFLVVVRERLCMGASAPEKQAAAALEEEVRCIWASICGAQETLSYCEFLAMLLPPTEDVFEDATAAPPPSLPKDPNSEESGSESGPSRSLPREIRDHWDPSAPISCFLPLLRVRRTQGKIPIFSEDIKVRDVVEGMSAGHHRWVVVRYKDGRQAFFDYMDVNHQLVEWSGGSPSRPSRSRRSQTTSTAMADIVAMPVGALANCSGHTPFVPMRLGTPLRHILRIIATGVSRGRRGDTPSHSDANAEVVAPRRVPILNECGEVVHVFSCIDFLDVALRFARSSAVLKSQSARTFDRRGTILEASVQNDAPLVDALRVMDASRSTVCPATLAELSGAFGGLVASNVVSATDLKLVVLEERHDVLDLSVNEFIAWRQSVMSGNVDHMLRQQRLQRFNVVSVDAGDSLHMLAHRLLASKLQRIFLSSDEISRIVGIVSSRDILVEVLDQLI